MPLPGDMQKHEETAHFTSTIRLQREEQVEDMKREKKREGDREKREICWITFFLCKLKF